ncbi:MAG: hypothetical protein QOJ40_2373 [Verrucomicrobiota bacterium]
MPEAKSGKAGSPVSPADPAAAFDADEADPGVVEKIKAEQRRTQTGKYGAEQVKPHKPPATPQAKKEKKSWIAIKMVDEADKPVTGMAYKVTLPDGETVAEGTLDDKGAARVEGIEPGSCKVTFPTLDKEAWKKA